MRKLLNTLFVLTPETYLSLDGENIIVHNGDEIAGRFPLHLFESVFYFGYKGASPALMGACAERGIGLNFFTPAGKFLTGIYGESKGNVLLRKKQYAVSSNEESSLAIAKYFIVGKIFNARWVLERAVRDYPMRINSESVKTAAAHLSKAYKAAANCTSIDSLRGLEGEAASRYFEVLDELILQNKEDFYFTSRSRRPPKDNFNAILSFTYTLMARDCTQALEGVGLDAYVGFLHRDRPGRTSLSLDLTEEFRSVICDRFALSLVNNRILNGKHFISQESGAVLLNDDGRKILLNAWQSRKKDTIKHPFLGETVPWGLVPYVQSLLLARYLRGDLDAYPPFLWK